MECSSAWLGANRDSNLRFGAVNHLSRTELGAPKSKSPLVKVQKFGPKTKQLDRLILEGIIGLRGIENHLIVFSSKSRLQRTFSMVAACCRACSCHTLAESTFGEKGFFHCANLLIQEVVDLMDQADQYDGDNIAW